jgi:hypothetical protein
MVSAVNGEDEISLVPSLWREMKETLSPVHEFCGPMALEWSKIIYSQFDLAAIERRQVSSNASGRGIRSAHDMEDADDPRRREFGRVGPDLMMGYDLNLADELSILLQPYRPRSPVLDLAGDLDVAQFFSFNRMRRPPEPSGHE